MSRWAESLRGDVPPSLWLALASATLTAAALALWAGGGGLRNPDAGMRTRELLIRDASPSLAAQSYYDALRHGRPERAMDVSIGQARDGARVASQQLRRQAPASGQSTFSPDETHRIDDRTLRLFVTLSVESATREAQAHAVFDVVSDAGAFRVSRMELRGGGRP